MRFKFRLAAIERIRASFERREKLRLMLATAHLANVQQRILALDAERLSARALLEQQLQAGLRGGEMHFHVVQAQTRALQRQELLQQATEAERRCQVQQVVYTKARRGHEIIKRLRERAWELHLQMERRREQQHLDELYLQTRSNHSPS